MLFTSLSRSLGSLQRGEARMKENFNWRQARWGQNGEGIEAAKDLLQPTLRTGNQHKQPSAVRPARSAAFYVISSRGSVTK